MSAPPRLFVTRFLREARALLWALVALLPIAPPTGAEEDGPGPLPWRVPGKVGFTADAASFPDSIGYRLEIYVRIPPVTLAGLSRGERGTGRLRLSARLMNRFGALHHEASQEFSIAASDTGAGFGKVVMLRFPVQSGPYRMQIRLEDLLSRRRGLAYMGRRVVESTSQEGEVTVPESQGDLRLSDVEFLWGEAPARTAPLFRRGASHEAGFLPNPERLYGLLAEDLKVQFVAHAGGDSGRAWRWSARVIDDAGNAIAEHESTAVAGPWLAQVLSFSVAQQPSGGYDFELRVWKEGDEQLAMRRGRFNIAWHSGSWRRNPRDVEDEVHFLLGPEEEKVFFRMGPGEQERHLENFWRRRDPTPGTAENETKDEFFKRVGHANRSWSRAGLGKGMFSDMGRVYIRHGEPDEILRQVLPTGDQTLTHLLKQIEQSEDRPAGEVRAKGLGGDIRSFEVWIYEGFRPHGPLTGLDAAEQRKDWSRILFLFVDEHGVGDYRLRYTTE